MTKALCQSHSGKTKDCPPPGPASPVGVAAPFALVFSVLLCPGPSPPVLYGSESWKIFKRGGGRSVLPLLRINQ